MAKSEARSGFLKFAKSLGHVTGQLIEKAQEAGLDKKAEELADKARAGMKRWMDEAEKSEGKKEASEGDEGSGEAEREGEAPAEPSSGDDRKDETRAGA